MKARLVQGYKSAMQSGYRNLSNWYMVFDQYTNWSRDNVMGWTRIRGAQQAYHLQFTSLEEARNYALKHNISLEIEFLQENPIVQPKSYAHNFIGASGKR